MTRPPACRMCNVRGGDRTRGAAAASKELATRPVRRPPGAYGVRQHAPGRGAGGEVLKFVNAGVLKLGKSVLVVLGV